MRIILLIGIVVLEFAVGHAIGVIEYKVETKLFIDRYDGGRFQAKLTHMVSTRFEKEDRDRVQPYHLSVPYFGSKVDFSAKLNNRSLNSEHVKRFTEDPDDQFLSDGQRISVAVPDQISGKLNVFSYELSYQIGDSGFIPMVIVPKRYDRISYQYTIHHPQTMSVRFQVTALEDSLKWETINRGPGQTQLVIYPVDLPVKDRAEWPFNRELALVQPELVVNNRPVNPFTPETFTTWYLGGLQKSKAGGPVTAVQLDSMARWMNLQTDILPSAFRFVTREVRYLADLSGGHSHVPHTLSHIMKRGYGDCKDKALLLQQAGILAKQPVFLALVSTNPLPALKSVSVNRFNHMIAAVQNPDGSYQFMDGTAKYLTWGEIPGNLEGAQALVLNPDRPELVTLPVRSESRSLSFSFKGRLDSLKAAQGSVILGTDYQRMAALLLDRKEGKENTDLLGVLVGKSLRNLPFSNLKLPDSLQKPISMQANLSAILVQSKSKNYFPVTPFTLFDPDIASRSSDTLDIYLDEPGRMSIRYDLIDPELTQPMSDSVLVQHEVFTFRAAITAGGGRVQLHQEIRFHQNKVSQAMKPGFLAAVNQIFKLRNKMFVQPRSTP